MLRRLIIMISAVLTVILIPLSASAASVSIKTLSASQIPVIRAEAYGWALTQAGKSYEWGGTGPYGYDCSGLVMEAYEHAGVRIPRTTYEMLDSPELRRTYHPVKGDLAFYGTGHVELFAGWSKYGPVTFGAHDYGQPVGMIQASGWWEPTMYYTLS
jgi:hypothetical protein